MVEGPNLAYHFGEENTSAVIKDIHLALIVPDDSKVVANIVHNIFTV